MRIALFLTSFVAFAPQSAYAACLLGNYSVQAEYLRSASVLIGKAVSERRVVDPDDPEGFSGTFYTVQIIETFRGSLYGTVELYSENSTGRFPMEMQKQYILFIYKEQGKYSADPCGNSNLVGEKKEVLADLRKLSKVDHPIHKTSRSFSKDTNHTQVPGPNE